MTQAEENRAEVLEKIEAARFKQSYFTTNVQYHDTSAYSANYYVNRWLKYIEFDTSNDVIKHPSYTLDQQYDADNKLIYSKECVGRTHRVLLDNRIKELTLQQIADKFNTPVENIRIKDNK